MLKGLKVLEFQGLAPSVFLGMYFADQGADVIIVTRPEPAPFSMQINKNIMNRNKKSIKLSLKDVNDKQILTQMIKKSHIIIDPYRPGVLEKQKIGPNDLYKINPKIILLRVTGYGQFGQMSLKPGHDLNYISSSGILKLINQSNDGKLQFPANYLADFVSASLGIIGTLKALKNRDKTGIGSVVDCSLAGGCSYLVNLIQEEEIIDNQKNAYIISYFEKGDKRYIVSQLKVKKNNSKEIIESIVSQMQIKNQQFFKNDRLEIAEIKKIKKIQDSQLKNPFRVTEKLLDKIPNRDQNRQQIMETFRIQIPKL